MKFLFAMACCALCTTLYLAPAAAQSQSGAPSGPQSFKVSAQCAGPFVQYRGLVNALLDASLHGEDAYTKLRSEKFDAASAAALKACRTDAQAKHAIYATNDQLSSYQATRDTALRLLQESPPQRRD